MITLATLPTASAQEVFDHISQHLLTQNAESTMDPGERCAYRTPQGLKCAAGCLISDEEYSSGNLEEFEDWGWSYLVEKGAVPPQHMELILELQTVHDYSSPDLWVRRLDSVAKQFDLEFKQ